MKLTCGMELLNFIKPRLEHHPNSFEYEQFIETFFFLSNSIQDLSQTDISKIPRLPGDGSAQSDNEPIETNHKLSQINFEPIEDNDKDIERNTSLQTAVNIDFGNKEGEFLQTNY